MENPLSASPKLRILLVGSQIEVAGAQKVLLDQAGWFKHRGHDVTAVFLYDKAGLGEIWQTQQPFPIIDLEARNLRSSKIVNFLRIARAAWRFTYLLRKNNFDVIESFTIHSNLFSIPLAYFLSIPIRIPTHHGYVGGVSGITQKIHGIMINSKLVSKMVAVSDKAGEIAINREGVKKEKISVILNGIRIPGEVDGQVVKAIREEFSVSEKDMLILSVGRLVEQKGYHLLVEAAENVVREFPGAKFVIAGDGKLRTSLQALVNEYNLAETICFAGVRQDIPEMLMAADIYFTTSLWEGLSLALLEAMAAGLPVVTTAVEGVSNVIMHGKNGLIAPIGDINAMANSLIHLIGDSRMRHSMGGAAKAVVVGSHSLEKMCEAYEMLFYEFYRP